MTQLNVIYTNFECSGEYTHSEALLGTILAAVPWSHVGARISPHSPRAETGRSAFPLLAMLRTHFPQQWYNLSDQHPHDHLCLLQI